MDISKNSIKPKRIVIKVGSAVLTQDDDIALKRMKALVVFLVKLREKNEVILVSSGAVAAGHTELKLDRKILKNKQALAAIGQPILMNKYAKKFAEFNTTTSQVLVTGANLQREDEIQRIKHTIDTLLENNILPIINENDATAIEELKVGDNDQLSAYLTKHTNSDMLVILSDIDGYYDKDPRKFENAIMQKVIYEISDKDLNKNATPHGDFATGGIVTKLKAANYLLENKIDTYLASGFDLKNITDLLIDGKYTGGTHFNANVGAK